MKTYDIYLVPNGRLRDFARGILGTGYPDACDLWGYDMTLDEVRERYRELADENFRRDGGEWDRIAEKNCCVSDGVTQSEEDEIGEKACRIADDRCAEYLEKLTEDTDPLAWESIEWNDDLKWVKIREHIED